MTRHPDICALCRSPISEDRRAALSPGEAPRRQGYDEPRAKVHGILHELAFPDGQWFLSGSGPMALRNMRPVGDIDIGVTTRFWSWLSKQDGWEMWTTDPSDPASRCDPPYLRRVVQGVEVNVFFGWRRRVDRFGREFGATDYNDLFKGEIELVEAWPCVTLPVLLRLKSEYQREKDMPDIAALALKIMEENYA